jgi:hypothetical protein
MAANFEQFLATWKKEWVDGVLLVLSDNEKNNAELLFVEMLVSENTVRTNCSEEYWNVWPSENLVSLLTQYGIKESIAVSAVHYLNKYKSLLVGLSEAQIKTMAATDHELFTILEKAFGLNT